MTFLDILPILIIALIVGLAAFYLYKQKKKGKTCIGCPYCDVCQSRGSKSTCTPSSAEKDNKS